MVGVGVNGPPGVDVVAGPDLRPLHAVRQQPHPNPPPPPPPPSVSALHPPVPSHSHPRRLYSSATITPSSIAASTGEEGADGVVMESGCGLAGERAI